MGDGKSKCGRRVNFLIRLLPWLGWLLLITYYLDWSKEIIQNILQNSVLALLTAIIMIGCYWLYLKESLFHFFGLSQINKILKIYLPAVVVPSTTSPDGRARPYYGFEINYLEHRETLRLQSLLSFEIPGDGFIANYFIRRHFPKIETEAILSSDKLTQIDSTSTIVVVGTATHNKASEILYQKHLSNIRFDGRHGADDMTLTVLQSNYPKAKDVMKSILVKKVDGGRCIFHVAGFEQAGTAAAFHYLITHWKKLHEDYPIGGFYVVLDIAGRDYTEPMICEKKALSS